MAEIHTDCFSFDFPTPWDPHPVIILRDLTAMQKTNKIKQHRFNNQQQVKLIWHGSEKKARRKNKSMYRY